MEKKAAARGTQLLQKIWIYFIFQIVFFVAGIFLISLLIYQEVIPISFDTIAVLFLSGVSAFFAAAAASTFLPRNLFAKGVFTQILFWSFMLLAGMMLCSAAVQWPHFLAAVGIALSMTAVAALIFNGKRKKKFQKNVAVRLKKK